MATKFLDFIQNQDAVSFKESFEAAVSEKVFNVLEAKKQEIAQSFFTEKKHVCPECGKAKCMCESESSERMGDPLAHSELAHHVANASATAAAAEHHKINFHAHIGKHTEAMAHGDHHAAHHHMEKAKMHAKSYHELTGHPIHEEMENGKMVPNCVPVKEAAKWRDAKHKDKLYTQEPYGDDDDRYSFYNPKPHDYPGAKRLKGGGEFDHNDPLRKGYGRGGTGDMNTHGKRKGMPSRDHVSSLKRSIKSAQGTHPRPNLPEAANHEEMENHLGIVGHHGGGFTGKGTPHSGHPSKGWPKAPAAGSAHDTGSKEHPAKHGEKVQTKFQKHHTDSAAHMDAVHADLSKHHHQHHMEEGHDKHEKKHAKLHHKLAKKMLKHAHKHGKKHHEEE